MRIKEIALSWFRGAAENTLLKIDGKSAVIYGDNGSGKSSFVDAFEYIITNGRIEHLRTEHASRVGQKNCVRNTNTQDAVDSIAKINFLDDTFVSAIIPYEGSVTYQSDPPSLIEEVQVWNRQSHILRQDEIAEFVKYTKSEKYSALTPLIGLREFEDIHENIKKLERRVKSESNFQYLISQRDVLRSELEKTFHTLDESEIIEIVSERLKDYNLSFTTDLNTSAAQGLEAVRAIFNELTPEIRRFVKAKKISETNLNDLIKKYKELAEGAKEVVTQLIDNKIAVLEKAEDYLDLEELGDIIECPVCGTKLPKEDIKDHVRSELDSLQELRSIYTNIGIQKREITIAFLRFKDDLNDTDLIKWFELPENKELKENSSFLRAYELPDEVARWNSEDLNQLESSLLSIIALLVPLIQEEPPSVVSLQIDRDLFSIAPKLYEYRTLDIKVIKISRFCEALSLMQKNIREKIVEITNDTLQVITSDVQQLWKKLHPEDPIEDIKIEKSLSIDTGIEISLQFHGKTQPSPLLTLSEGHRNSLGLCVFISMVKQEPETHPIILDDIVSSLDRDHRGFVVEVLNTDLNDRQVLLFTHDREWYDELKRRLSRGVWDFYDLRWDNPTDGILISPTQFTFEKARQYIPDHTNAAGNACRAIMDDEFALICEKLEVPIPFRRGPSNDHRTWKEFSDSLISVGERNLQSLDGNGNYQRFSDPIEKIRESQGLLETWANRGSHGGQIMPQEVSRMISVCETAIQFFKACPECGRPIWHAKSAREAQCRCGKYRWRF